jgi:nucleoid DNA-binding protein
MEKHILNLLNHNLRVIIPDFGAFIIRQKEPVIIVFNEFLKYNDGLLIDYIAKTEQIEKEIARQKVVDYAENILKTLNAGKEFKIAGVGILRKAESEKIEFIQSGSEPPKQSAQKQAGKAEAKPAEAAPSIELSDEKAKTVEKSPENNLTEKPKQENAHAKASEHSATEKKEKNGNSIKKPLERPAAEPSKEVIEKPVQKATIPQTQFKPIHKKKNNQQLIWVILIILFVALINGWFIFNKDIRNYIKSWRLSVNTSDTLGQMVTNDTLAQPVVKDINEEADDESYIKESEPSEAIPAEPPKKESEAVRKKYYIVAGCFRDENNANALVRDLIQKGYKAEKFGTIGNLHAVSYNSFTDKEEALRALARIRQEIEPEAWMLYY